MMMDVALTVTATFGEVFHRIPQEYGDDLAFGLKERVMCVESKSLQPSQHNDLVTAIQISLLLLLLRFMKAELNRTMPNVMVRQPA